MYNKVLSTPLPHDGNFTPPDQPLNPKMLFAGSVSGFNWHRAFWLSACHHRGLPIEQKVSNHATDGLSALDSYRVYMQGLSASTSCINFAMRSDLTSIVTGRCFEVIVSGSLLVQEATPDMHYYFTAGEHYLEFSTFSELCAIARFITENKDEAEAIRRNGYDFVREKYGDDKIVGYIDEFLFYQNRY